MGRIFLSSPHMSEQGRELDYIHDAFEKNWIAPLGENVTGFEADVKAYVGAESAVALSSGTAALHLAVMLAGVKPGDLVFCQDLTFSASANPVAYVGAKPVFIDSERDTWNMDPKALELAVARHGVPKAVIAVHLYGIPAKMERISEICKAHHVPLIEDAAEALGSRCGGAACGAWGDFSALSFNGNKIITTSGGGMLLCRRQEDASHALKLATQAREPFPWYEHKEIGYNYRMSNICAGIGRGQMTVLDQRVSQKQAIYDGYCHGLAGLPLTMSPCREGDVSNRWLSVCLLERDCGVSPSQIIDALEAEDMEARRMWKPMHMQPVFAAEDFVSVEAEAVDSDLFERGVCLPSDTKMGMADVERICAVIRKLF